MLEDVQGYTVQSNATFNWGVAPRIGVGIREDAESFSNVIAGNNVNYFETAIVAAEGRDSVVRDNVGYADKPHQGLSDTLQTFRPEMTEKFIATRQCGRVGGD